MVDPYFSMLWRDDIPTVTEGGAEVTVIAGRFGATAAPTPPPDSWASGDNDVAIWHLRLTEDGSTTLPPASEGSTRVLYLFEGSAVIEGQVIGADTGVVLDGSVPVDVAGGPGGSEGLILQGRPIGEPVAQYGPFVLNDEAGIRQAMADYQRTGFGGWPWPTDDPVHGPDPERFADRVDVAAPDRSP